LLPASERWRHWAGVAAEQTLIGFTPDFDTSQINASDAKVSVVATAEGPRLQVATGHKGEWPGITLRGPEKGWDLSAYSAIVAEVKNCGSESLKVHLRVDCPGGDGAKNSVTENVTVSPGETKTLRVRLKRRLPAALSEKLFAMRGFPGGFVKESGLDATQITQFVIFVDHPKADHSFEIADLRATGSVPVESWQTMTPDTFFPMIDTFGQFIHRDWPGKIHSEQELLAASEREQGELAAQPAPNEWNAYGGWNAGPQLKATGFFYPQARRQVVAGRSRRPFVLVARHRLRPLVQWHDADHRPRVLLCRTARQGFAAERVLRPGVLGTARVLQGQRKLPNVQLHRQQSVPEVRPVVAGRFPASMPRAAAKLGTEHDRQLVGLGHLPDAANAVRRSRSIPGGSRSKAAPDTGASSPIRSTRVPRDDSPQHGRSAASGQFAWCLGVFVDNELAGARNCRWRWRRWPRRRNRPPSRR
jgi:hypothetical protein